MFTVVCICRNGNIMRFQRRNHAEALAELDLCESSGIYVSGSIFDEDDNELEGFCV